ncbi:hypothetical protein [Pseudarthrobacter sp. ATCC 49987]|uniref:hypothetical protein n=1 Tax=Pseudarthrobacter sp. ATCC 49987 TaxID=2698204 RepID=UPI00136C84B1|nr:hypothetical protein [Pseudarthrobacter sp. ATCC 49987]
MSILDRLRQKPTPTPKEIHPVNPPSTVTPPTPAEHLNASRTEAEAARTDAENALIRAAELRARLIDGDRTVTPDDVDAAETKARHAALALESANAAYQKAYDQERRAAWSILRDEQLGYLLDNPASELSAALEKLAPRVRAAVAELQAALTEAQAPVMRHNAAVGALTQYVAGGGYTDPADHAVQHGGSMYVSGRGGAVLDPTVTVDLWLATVLPARKDIAAWLERVRVARILAGLPNEPA